MSFISYFISKLDSLFINIVGCLALSVYLLFSGVPMGSLLVIIVTWICVYIIYTVGWYLIQRQKQKKVLHLAKALDKRYLLWEVMDKPKDFQGRFYYELLGLAGKSMVDEVAQAKRQKKDYKEYIEQWVHEIKNPLAAIKLACQNQGLNHNSTLMVNLNRMENYVDQSLYFARSEVVDQDYLIREINLKKCLHEAILYNKYSLMTADMAVETEQVHGEVYCDDKWLIFMLNQILQNAIKYRCEDKPQIRCSTIKEKNGTTLIIEDNGIGIDEKDVKRVFNKGFTGDNGRHNEKSTGIGLYLVHQLSDKLGISVDIKSKKNESTTVSFYFPINYFTGETR